MPTVERARVAAVDRPHQQPRSQRSMSQAHVSIRSPRIFIEMELPVLSISVLLRIGWHVRDAPLSSKLCIGRRRTANGGETQRL